MKEMADGAPNGVRNLRRRIEVEADQVHYDIAFQRCDKRPEFSLVLQCRAIDRYARDGVPARAVMIGLSPGPRENEDFVPLRCQHRNEPRPNVARAADHSDPHVIPTLDTPLNGSVTRPSAFNVIFEVRELDLRLHPEH